VQCYVVGFAFLLASASVCDAQARKWTDVTGKYSVEAELVEFKDGQVRLRKPDGQEITVPLGKLSAADQQHVRQQVTESGSPQAEPRKLPGAPSRAPALPCFPDALTEPPAWIGPEVPFDVTKFLDAPSPEENAAPLYLDALFEFGSETSFCFCHQGESPQSDTKRRMQIADQRCQEYLRFDEAWQKDPASVDLAAVDAWLQGYETGFEKLARAQRRPACAFETGVGLASLLPHAQAARQVARVAEWRIRRDLARGDFERPIQAVEMVLRLSRDLRPRGHEVCQLVSVSLDVACCQQMVPAILTAPRITAQHCDRLSAALARHEAEARDPFLEATRVHYIVDRTALHDLQNHTGMFDPQYMKEVLEVRGPVDSPFTCLIVLLQLGDYGDRLAREKYGDLATLTPEEAFAHPLVRGRSVDGKLRSEDDYAKEVEAINQVYKSLLGLGDRTNLQRDRACRCDHCRTLAQHNLGDLPGTQAATNPCPAVAESRGNVARHEVSDRTTAVATLSRRPTARS
jgi:hypothetical protein